ncbi:4-(cytidine 5'-diphospho)-2-C-methyl-D-erythritol kinase [Parvularcula marina]|uniref:4-diphosphocytidyl-2-C-methyl-D-erythritol kinase n=1 Tax=Parvularcula marina TaxID=2292771 RepID=A0A371RFV9_9PROT|nr:4-(cytidine 5'-diphospho)-2-C-methyl-D-erythritol kinase [Parvularcula marina]RFB04326.1 4-(cytidine 5'-diphospho)-2-C-methyl-D-erythritol kinase [Parvularcula marina]
MPLAEIQSLAKINLALHVGGVRPDGYHPVDTLCVFASAGDVLSIEEETDEFSLIIDGEEGAGLSPSTDNLVLRAARAFAVAADIRPVRFRLTKNVPVASGIGGGTSNGAAALALLNQRASVPLSVPGLMALSQGLGADGPVCLAPYIMSADSFRARGIGFAVTNGPSLPPLHIALANPRQAVPTGTVFRAFDKAAAPSPFELPETARLASSGDVASFLSGTRNDLAPPARVICPAIAALEAEMSAQPGCLGARMSGSGATVFGLYASASAATRAARRFVAEGHWAVSSPLFRKGAS